MRKKTSLLFRANPFYSVLIREEGVTLLELLVALTITVLLGTALTAVFRTSMDAWQKGEATTQRTQTARIALQRMSKDIRSAVLLTGWKDVSGKDVRFYGENSYNSFGDKLSFITLVHPPDYNVASDYYYYDEADEWDAAEISYYIYSSATTGLDHLIRRWQVGDIPDDKVYTGGLDYTVASLTFRVKELNFSYYDGSNWQTSWNSNITLPEKVWIGLTVQDDRPREQKEEVISAMVYLP